MMRRSVGSPDGEATGLFSRLRTGQRALSFHRCLFFCGKGGKVDAMDCFAKNENGNCNILRCGKCQGETCHFHKTREEQAQSLEKVSERLLLLPIYSGFK
ncbi:hypothetical protein [Parablautia muri]|nr:hypothetical protein [Parablautia muri]